MQVAAETGMLSLDFSVPPFGPTELGGLVLLDFPRSQGRCWLQVG